MSLDRLVRKYKDKDVTIVAMAEMAGFPNPITGNMPKYNYVTDFQHILETIGASVDAYQFQSLFFQKATFIEDVLKSDITVEELRTLLANSVDVTKNRDFIANIGVRSSLKQIYDTDEEDENIKVTDLIKRDNMLFIRSSMSQDLMFACQENQFSVFSKKHAMKAIEFLQDERFINQLLQDIENNYKQIYTLNPSARIFEIGITPPKSYILPYLKELSLYLNRYIERVQDIAGYNHVMYIEGNPVEGTSLGTDQILISADMLTELGNYVEDDVYVRNADKTNYPTLKSLSNQRWYRYNQTVEKMLKDERYTQSDVTNVTNEWKQEMECFQKTINMLKR